MCEQPGIIAAGRLGQCSSAAPCSHSECLSYMQLSNCVGVFFIMLCVIVGNCHGYIPERLLLSFENYTDRACLFFTVCFQYLNTDQGSATCAFPCWAQSCVFLVAFWRDRFVDLTFFLENLLQTRGFKSCESHASTNCCCSQPVLWC